MRRLIALALLALLLAGCGERRETATFYYPRAEMLYGQQDGVLAAEERDVTGHGQDLTYLLYQYLLGPSQEGLIAAVPAGVRLLAAQQEGQTLTLRFSDDLAALPDRDFTLACACLSMTCLELTDARQVAVCSGQRVMTMTAGDLVLYDSLTAQPTEETQ